jgi:hypothetical protein
MTIIISSLASIATAGLNDVLIQAVEQGDTNTVKLIIDDGADINAKNIDGMTLLMYASLRGHLETVRTLIVKGADVNAKKNDGVTSLMYASLGGHLEIVQALLAKGADVNAKKNDGITALLVATKSGKPEVVQALLAKGADVNAKSRGGWTALTIASVNALDRVEKLLKEAGAQESPRHSARAVGDTLQTVLTSHAESGEFSQSATSPVPMVITTIPPAVESAVTPVATVQPIVFKPAKTDATTPTPQAPHSEKQLEQRRAFYTLSTVEIMNRSKLDIILDKLKASGLQPVVREEKKSMEVFRLVTKCFSVRNDAQKSLANIKRKEKKAYIVHNGERFCVAVASFFSYEAAQTGQRILAKNGLTTELIKAPATLTSWWVTIGRYSDILFAEAELKRLAKGSTDVVLIALDE